MYIDWFFLISSVITLFMSILFFLSYFSRNKYDPKPQKFYGISILVPMWNEENTILTTLNSLKEVCSNYKGDSEVIVIDNNSTDNSYNIVKKYSSKHNFVRVVQELKKQGKSYAFNTGIKYAKYELIACVDADSYPTPKCLNSMIGYFDDSKVGAVTSKMVVKSPKNVVEYFQDLEYIYSNFLLTASDTLESIYVTKGPLSIYRKSILVKIKGFEHPNITPTEDMEITFRIRKLGYIIKSSKDAIVYTSVMPTWKKLFWQRIRWNRGAMINFNLHKDIIFNPKYDFFGLVFMPLITLTMFMIVCIVYFMIMKVYKNIFLVLQKLYYYLTFKEVPNIVNYIMTLKTDFLFVIPSFIILFVIILLLYFILNYLGFKDSGEKITIKRLFVLLLSLIIYFPIQIYFWVCAIIIQITKKSSKWR